MTIDERLDRLTERHEGLAQSLELLTADVRDLQVTVRQQSENIDKLVVESATQRQALVSVLEAVQELTVNTAAQHLTMDKVLTGMSELIGVVTRHEQRIQQLEDRG